MNILLLAFPLALALLLAAYHVLALLLWLDPSVSGYWMALAWTRAHINDFDMLVGMTTGLTSGQTLLVLLVCIGPTIAMWGKARIWSAALLNHVLTLMLMAAPFTFQFAQASLTFATPADIVSTAANNILDFEYGAVTYLGLIACIATHVAFLRKPDKKRELSALEMRYRCGCL